MHRPGGPSEASEQMLAMGANQATKGPSYKYTWSKGRKETGASTDFPIVATNANPYDDVANIKSEYSSSDMGNNWVVPFTEQDAMYVKSKRDAMEKANFDDWVWRKFNLSDPAQNLMLQQIAPELYERRAELIDWNQNLASNYAKVRLRGPKNINDLMFEWMIETGRVELPKSAVWDPLSWREAQFGTTSTNEDNSINYNRYAYGLFSPLRFLDSKQAGWLPKRSNRFDIQGDKDRKVGAPALQRYATVDPEYTDDMVQATQRGLPMNYTGGDWLVPRKREAFTQGLPGQRNTTRELFTYDDE